MTLFILKLTLCWGFFALLYALLLRHETFFRLNRLYLLGTAALRITYPSSPTMRDGWQPTQISQPRSDRVSKS